MGMKRFFSAALLSAGFGPDAAKTPLPAVEWPRHPGSGRIEFVGTLPWPTDSPTPNQRKALVVRWFASHLTDMPAADYPPANSRDTTYSGVPNWAYLDSVRYSPEPHAEKVIYRLFYQAELVPVSSGLAYRLHDFECAEMGSDFSNSVPLEEALPKFALHMRGYERRLQRAMAGW
jgi:hypothetical protein